MGVYSSDSCVCDKPRNYIDKEMKEDIVTGEKRIERYGLTRETNSGK
jgi:hypothetical protein